MSQVFLPFSLSHALTHLHTHTHLISLLYYSFSVPLTSLSSCTCLSLQSALALICYDTCFYFALSVHPLSGVCSGRFFVGLLLHVMRFVSSYILSVLRGTHLFLSCLPGTV